MIHLESLHKLQQLNLSKEVSQIVALFSGVTVVGAVVVVVVVDVDVEDAGAELSTHVCRSKSKFRFGMGITIS